MVVKHPSRVIFTASFLLFQIVSCSSPSNIFMSGAPVIESTSPKEVIELSPVDSIKGTFMEDVIGLHCLVDSVAVLQLADSDCWFRALNLKTKRFVDFLPVGRGAGEVVFGYFSRHRIVDGVNVIDIVDMQEHKLYSIDLDRTIEQSATVILNITELSKESGPSYIIADKRLEEITFDSSGYTLRLVDGNNTVIKEDFIYGEDKTIPRYQPLFCSSKHLKPDAEKLAMVMPDFDKINIYDITGNNHFSISTKNDVDDKSILSGVQKTGTFGNHYYYFDSHDATDNYIYAIYYDSDWIASEFEHSPTIQIFDWSGSYCRAIKVNEYLSSIVVSKDESVLYGLVGREGIYLYAL